MTEGARVRAMTEDDIAAVMDIDALCFDTPWSESDYRTELSRPQACLIVAERDGVVIGYANYWIVADEAQVMNIATAPAVRRSGVARTLLRHIVDDARIHACGTVTLEVRRSNEAARALYAAFGFRSVGVRPGYYGRGEGSEDAMLMTAWL